jgi:hypothetical protein
MQRTQFTTLQLDVFINIIEQKGYEWKNLKDKEKKLNKELIMQRKDK